MATTTYNSEGSVTIGKWTIAEGHEVTYTQTNDTGLFARRIGSHTNYSCTCGKRKFNSSRALKSALLAHDTWTTREEDEANSPLAAILDQLVGA